MKRICRPLASPRAAWWLLLVLLVAATAHAGNGKVHAFLDRTQAQMGDTVTLNIEVDGTTQAAAPDVGALASDFDVLGRSHSTSINIVNGRRSVKTLWAIQLKPRHAGRIVIPPLQVDGERTPALTLTVGKAPATASGGPGDPVFLKLDADTRTPYVGQQVALTVRLFYVPSVNSGSIDLPQGSNIELRPTGRTSRYQVQRNGRFYHVLEKHYALIPRKAGTLDPGPVRFRGSMARAGSFADFFGQGQPVEARSSSIHLAVRARPSAAGKGTWLPARKLSLKLSGWPADGKIEAGQPLTLTLTEKATGLPFDSLPKLAWPKTPGVRVYPDRAHKHTDDSGRWLVGTRTRKFVLVAGQAGEVSLPAITLSWWNVVDDRRETARIPAHQLHVIAALGQQTTSSGASSSASGISGGAVAGASSVSASPKAKPVKIPAASRPDASGHVWAWVALGLWVLTMLAAGGYAWHRHRRHANASAASKPGAGPGRRGRRRAFVEAAHGGDVAAQCETLLAWAREQRPALRQLGELARALQPGPQTAVIADLERARYAERGQGPDENALLSAFAKGFAWRGKSSRESSDDDLPPLYPL